MRNRVWVVFDENKPEIAIFSTKKKAEDFISKVYPGTGVQIKSVESGSIDSRFVDCYAFDHVFVYIVYLSLSATGEENWKVIFVGYSMDLSDERDIVFKTSCNPNTYQVVILSKNYQSSLDIGKKIITEAVKGGPFNGNYDKPGYIDSCRDRYLEPEIPENSISDESIMESVLERLESLESKVSDLINQVGNICNKK